MHLLRLLALSLFLSFSAALFAQEESPQAPPVQEDSIQKKMRKFDILPALSYAPETGFTMGVIGFYYLDLARQDPTNHISNISFLAVYTTRNQILLETEWELFTQKDDWRFRGELYFNKYPDRNYGAGNQASVLVIESEEDGNRDTVNFLQFDSNRYRFSPVALRRVYKNLYAGLQAEVEILNRYQPIPENFEYLTADSTNIINLPVEGFRAGLGIQLLYDNRDNVMNPMRGWLAEAGSLHFGKGLGSEFTYHSFLLDIRKYINPVSNHTLALRAVLNHRDSPNPNGIPLRGLSRVGGKDFIRGYFKGTFQEKMLSAFEIEYRLPFWREDADSKLWQIWKRLGIVAFVGGAQVQENWSDWRFSEFNLAAGGGLRVLFNKESRLNIRIDYAFGLAPNSNGLGKRQSGLYFFLAEAF
jgi:outer membrane protein assembly factor BamA